MTDSFEEWKEDWRNNRDVFEENQAEVFKSIRERHNLERRIEKAVEESVKDLSKRIAEAVYQVSG